MKKNKKPIAVVFGDVHLKNSNIETVYDIIKQICSYMMSEKIDLAIFLGDFFHDRNSQNLQRLITIRNIVQSFGLMNKRLLAIQGNHEKTDLTSPEGYLSIYTEPGSRAFILYETYHFVDLLPGLRLHFIPYFLEGEIYEGELKQVKIKPKAQNILFTHIAVNGVENNDGTLVTNGMSVDSFSDFNTVLIGHYHEASFIEPNIYYVGSTHQSNFGESAQDKGFTILYDDGSIKHQQTEFKEYVQLEVQAKDKNKLREVLKQFDQYNFKEFFIRLKLVGSAAELEGIDVSEFKRLGIDVRYVNNVEAYIPDSLDTQELTVFSKGELMKNFIKFSQEQQLTIIQRNQGLNYLKNL